MTPLERVAAASAAVLIAHLLTPGLRESLALTWVSFPPRASFLSRSPCVPDISPFWSHATTTHLQHCSCIYLAPRAGLFPFFLVLRLWELSRLQHPSYSSDACRCPYKSNPISVHTSQGPATVPINDEYRGWPFVHILLQVGGFDSFEGALGLSCLPSHERRSSTASEDPCRYQAPGG